MHARIIFLLQLWRNSVWPRQTTTTVTSLKGNSRIVKIEVKMAEQLDYLKFTISADGCTIDSPSTHDQTG